MVRPLSKMIDNIFAFFIFTPSLIIIPNVSLPSLDDADDYYIDASHNPFAYFSKNGSIKMVHSKILLSILTFQTTV